MKAEEFSFYKTLLHKESGLTITPDKAYLLESRLTPVAKKAGLENLDALGEKLKQGTDAALLKQVVDAMTTNETSFFRDQRPFDIFKDELLPYFKENRLPGKPLRIWSAASSSGQEPYTLAMILKEHGDLIQGRSVEILATDICNEILDQAKTGRYTQFEVQRGLPIQLLMKYFEQQEDSWVVKDEIRKMVTFQNFNLLHSMTGFGAFDIILCRNVLIYFDEETKTDVLKRLSGQLAPDGFMMLGGAETVLGLSDNLIPKEGLRGVYILRDNEVQQQDDQAVQA